MHSFAVDAGHRREQGDPIRPHSLRAARHDAFKSLVAAAEDFNFPATDSQASYVGDAGLARQPRHVQRRRQWDDALATLAEVSTATPTRIGTATHDDGAASAVGIAIDVFLAATPRLTIPQSTMVTRGGVDPDSGASCGQHLLLADHRSESPLRRHGSVEIAPSRPTSVGGRNRPELQVGRSRAELGRVWPGPNGPRFGRVRPNLG